MSDLGTTVEINTVASFTEYSTTEPTADFAIGFDYDEQSDTMKGDAIIVTLNRVDPSTLGYIVTLKNKNTVSFSPSVPSGNTVRLQRETDIDTNLYTFSAGALFVAKNVDSDFEQIRKSQQEVRDKAENILDYTEAKITDYDNRVQTVELATAKTQQDLASEVLRAKSVELGLQNQINNTGNINTITPVESVKDLQELTTWSGRVVYVRYIGMYTYLNSAWVYTPSLVFNTVAEMLQLSSKYDGMLFKVKSYNTPNYVKANPFEGGGDFTYVDALKNKNDGGVCINGCVRVATGYLKLTPEMFGAVGDGTTDDYTAIQNMLNAGASGCVFEFDGSKIYYNAMANSGVAIDLDKRNLWKRTLPSTFNFNNAELKVRTPLAVANGTYSDTGGYVLLLDSIDGIFVNDANINGNSPLGTVKWIDMTDWYNAPKDTYCVGNTGFEGIKFSYCKNIKFTGKAQRCGFNIFLDHCEHFKIDAFTQLAMQSIQGIIDSNNTDAALGCGLKVYFCKHGKIDVQGYRNVNATPEIESNNYDVEVNGFGEEDFSNSLMVYASQHIRLNYSCKNTFGGGFVLYAKSGQFPMSSQFVTGQVTIDGCNNVGFVFNCDNIAENIDGIDLDITTKACKSGGMQIINASTTAMPRNIKINHTSINDGENSNWQRYFSGYMTGRIKGSSVWDTKPTNTNYCIKIEGANTKDTCLVFELDLTDNDLYPYSVLDSAYMELFGTRLSYATQYMSARSVDFKTVKYGARSETSGGSEINFSGANLNLEIATDGGYVKSNMLSLHNAQENALFVDPSTRTANGNGFVYTIKMYKPT